MSEFEDISIDISKTESKQKKKNTKTPQNIQELWDSRKMYNIHVVRIPGRGKKGTEEIFDKIMTISPNECQTSNHRSRMPIRVNSIRGE